MILPHGKIPLSILKDVVFKNLGAKRQEVILGPSAGIDGAVIDAGDRSLIVSMDPITGALDRIGWLAVNINANDVATFGVEPAFMLSCVMLPEKASAKTVATISSQMDKAAKALGIAIIGGHCETTPGLTNPIVVGCAIGIAEKGKFVTAGEAKPEDKLILTKSAGIEGTAILATGKRKQLRKTVGEETLRRAANFYEQVSVVRDALTAISTGSAHAMHDPTEGGLAGGIHEMADASNLGVRIFKERIAIAPETAKICGALNIDPLQLIASGSLLIAAERDSADRVVQALKEKSVNAAIIGEFLPSTKNRSIVGKEGWKRLVRPRSDHLWLALERSA